MIELPDQQPISFDEFIAWYPEGAGHHYELHNGIIVELPRPTGQHSEIAGFIIGQLGSEIDRLQLPWFIPRYCTVKVGESGYQPDVIVLSDSTINNEPRWKPESVIIQGDSIPLLVEVVGESTKSIDYRAKRSGYAVLDISEYWIVDLIDQVVTGCSLAEGFYDASEYRGGDRIVSPTFSDLALTAEQVFAVGQ